MCRSLSRIWQSPRDTVCSIRGPEQKLADLSLNRWLRLTVYEDKGVFGLFAVSFIEGGLCLALMLWLAVPYDIRRFKQMKYGRILRGPQLLSPQEFNRQQKGDGIGFKTTELGKMMRIPAAEGSSALSDHGRHRGRENPAHHANPAADSRPRRLRHRLRSGLRIHPAILRRGARRHRSEPAGRALPILGTGAGDGVERRGRRHRRILYQPATDAKDEFFHQTPAQIFAHLLRKGPTPHQLAEWMANSDTLGKLVAGTEMSFYIDRKAGPQRAGVLASLGLVAKCFRLLPEKDQTDRDMECPDWAKERKGWIFITSRPPERETLRPLHSLWIDLLVMRLLTAPQPGQKPVWFVIDELASLQKLPQLHTAITENRKSKNPLVLGFQGKAQLEVIYGHLAEVMLSQPATKIFMKTAEPKAAEWISEAIGKVEIERLKETKFDGSRSGKNFTVDRQIEPLVMGSEISGLDDRHAYLKLGNNVARFDFDYLDLPTPTPGFCPGICGRRDELRPRHLEAASPEAGDRASQPSPKSTQVAALRSPTKARSRQPSACRSNRAAGRRPGSDARARRARRASVCLAVRIMHDLQAPLEELEHAVHPGIF